MTETIKNGNRSLRLHRLGEKIFEVFISNLEFIGYGLATLMICVCIVAFFGVLAEYACRGMLP